MTALKQALQFIASGQARCVSPASDAAEYLEFQAMAEALLEAKQSGLVYEAIAERSRTRETYGHIRQVIVAGGLTPKGRLLHEQSQATPFAVESKATDRERPEPEIIQLRPTFAGMSIDLKALWRKWRTKK